MDFGVCLPNFTARATTELIDAAAEGAVRHGWTTVWTTDHVLVDHSSEADYGTIFEAITTLAYLAGRLPTLRLGTSVIVVPQRNAVILAKELATLDELSGGRLIAGIGIGWSESEFANVGAADRFHVRGAYLEETIRLWRHLWAGSSEPFHGRFHVLDDFVFGPLPRQGSALPIVVGGRHPKALRRIGMLADGYHASQASPAMLAERIPTVRDAAQAAGRSMPSLSARVRVRLDEPADPSAYTVHGSPAEVAAELRAFAAVGLDHLALDFPGGDPSAYDAAMARFGAEVVPLL